MQWRKLEPVPNKVEPVAEKQLQIKITPSDQQYRLVLSLVESGYLKDSATVVSACLNRALPLLVAECISHEKFLGGDSVGFGLRLFLLRSAAGEFVPDSDLTLIAHDSGMSVEVLKQIRSCFIKEGSKSNAIVS